MRAAPSIPLSSPLSCPCRSSSWSSACCGARRFRSPSWPWRIVRRCCCLRRAFSPPASSSLGITGVHGTSLRLAWRDLAVFRRARCREPGDLPGRRLHRHAERLVRLVRAHRQRQPGAHRRHGGGLSRRADDMAKGVGLIMGLAGVAFIVETASPSAPSRWPASVSSSRRWSRWSPARSCSSGLRRAAACGSATACRTWLPVWRLPRSPSRSRGSATSCRAGACFRRSPFWCCWSRPSPF